MTEPVAIPDNELGFPTRKLKPAQVFEYDNGFVASGLATPPKEANKADIIWFRLERNERQDENLTIWLRPDEAAAIISCLACSLNGLHLIAMGGELTDGDA